jgi:hypothetical protein
MRRRSFLAATATGAAVGLSGCLDGEVVMEVNETNTIPANRAWIQEIDEAEGSGGVAYTVRSEHSRFEVFYFRDNGAFQTYQQSTLGSDEIPENPPTGYDPLRAIAVKNTERDAYEAVIPDDGGRHSLDFDGTHYFVVDNSNYGDIGVRDKTADLPVVVSLEVVEDRF